MAIDCVNAHDCGGIDIGIHYNWTCRSPCTSISWAASNGWLATRLIGLIRCWGNFCFIDYKYSFDGSQTV